VPACRERSIVGENGSFSDEPQRMCRWFRRAQPTMNADTATRWLSSSKPAARPRNRPNPQPQNRWLSSSKPVPLPSAFARRGRHLLARPYSDQGFAGSGSWPCPVAGVAYPSRLVWVATRIVWIAPSTHRGRPRLRRLSPTFARPVAKALDMRDNPAWVHLAWGGFEAVGQPAPARPAGSGANSGTGPIRRCQWPTCAGSPPLTRTWTADSTDRTGARR